MLGVLRVWFWDMKRIVEKYVKGDQKGWREDGDLDLDYKLR